MYQQSPEEFREETTRAKACLEDIIGQAVLGCRAASFSVTRASPWALDVTVDPGQPRIRVGAFSRFRH